MNSRIEQVAARYFALPESVRDRCPRPLENVTPEAVRAWLLEVRDVCLDASAATIKTALGLAGAGDVAGAEALKAEAADLLDFARELGDAMGFPPAEVVA